MRVLDVTGPQRPLKIEVSTSPAYELLMSLCLFDSDPDYRHIFEIGDAWFERIEEKVSPELIKDMRKVSVPHSKTWAHLLGVVYATPAPRDIPAFLAHLETIPAMDLRLRILGYQYHGATHGDLSRETIRAAAGGECAAQKQLADAWYGDEPENQEALSRLLSNDVETTKRQTVTLLRAWYEAVFREEEPRVMPAIERDAEAKRHLARSMPAERIMEIATNGVQYRGEPGIERVVLIPSVLYRPWVLISGSGDAKILCYPVADESLALDADAPPTHMLRLSEALADERRLRVMRKIASEPCSLQELADFLGIAKSTMHHHLAILRGAGLLQVELGGKRYRLRREALTDLPALIDTYLDREAPQPIPSAYTRSQAT